MINLDTITLTDDELERIAIRVEHYDADEADARYRALVNAAKFERVKAQHLAVKTY